MLMADRACSCVITPGPCLTVTRHAVDRSHGSRLLIECDVLLQVLRSSPLLEQLADTLWGGLAKLVAASAASGLELHDKFCQDGGAFTLSRNDTQVLRVDPAGNATVLTDPLQVNGAVKVGGNLEVGGELLLGGVRIGLASAPEEICASPPISTLRCWSEAP